MSAGPMLEVDDLSISYGSRLLVNGVSFALDSGESLALVGESGSGKSLTARAIADLLPAGVSAIGRVLIEGAPVRR
ncbi:MAG: ATP-binding cassette domain-containing protein, partial [Candidatus Nanopelagicales bacterium]|nr:ATP-binding cassette domain-containing protein [Candidatus Nanopelagicales bacterium]